jgi:hypothetical protein
MREIYRIREILDSERERNNEGDKQRPLKLPLPPVSGHLKPAPFPSRHSEDDR